MLKSKLRLSAAVLGASVAFMPGIGAAQSAAPAPVLSAPAREPVLRRFPLSADDLTFSGENGARDIPLYVAAAETAGNARLVLDMQSAVSILPSASEMVVLVNDTFVGRTRLADMDRKTLEVDLPTGLLQPGFNAVSLIVNQSHRVDCSVDATYELWTRLNAETSGILLSAGLREIRSLADLPSLGRTHGGQLSLRGRIPADASPAEIENTLAAIQAVVVAAGIDRPSVEFNELPGSGDGFDVAVGTFDSLRRAGIDIGQGREPRVTIAPGASGRSTLTIAAADGNALADLLKQFASFAETQRPAGSASGLKAVENVGGRALESGSTVRFADLGFREPSFSGRFYRDQVKFVLPPDFYAADYSDAVVNLEAAYAANLTQGAQLLVRANGHIVSTLGLSSIRGGTLSGQRLPIPLSKLRPGENTITFEAYTPSVSDVACDTTTGASEPRLFISGETTLAIPTIARIGHLPDLAASASGLSQLSSGQPVMAYMPRLSGATLDAAGTYFAQLAARSGRIQPLDLTTSAPSEQTGEMIAFGRYADLPPALLAYVGLRQSGLERTSAVAPATETSGGFKVASVGDWFLSNVAVTPAAASAPAANAGVLASFAQPFDLRTRLGEIGEDAGGTLRDLGSRAIGFIKPSEQEDHAEYLIGASDALVLAQRPAPSKAATAWTVVASADDAKLLAGVSALATASQWSQLGGAITAVSTDGAVTAYRAKGERLFETQPRTLQNGRLVIAGWFSRQMERYVAGLLAMAVLLGLTTHLFVRSLGKRR